MNMALAQVYHIGIDCRLLGKKHAGIGRYIENLLLEIPHTTVHPHFTFSFIFHDQAQWQDFLKETDQPKFFKSQNVVFAPVRHYTLYEQLHMPSIIGQLNLDLLHVPHFNIPVRYNGQLVVTIHDLLWHEYRGTQVTTLPAWKYWVKHGLYKRIVAQAVRKAQKIFVPTQTIKDTVLKYFPDTSEKILITKEGVGKAFINAPLTRTKLSAKNKRIIYVGSLYPHKNIDVVLQSLAQLPDFSLDLIGARNVFQEVVRKKVHELKLGDRVQFLGYKTDQELVELFKTSFALVQPSLFEGFGLTGLEAMAVGLPVIASDIPVFQEIYKDRAIFFDPHQVDRFVAAVKQLESDAQLYGKFSGFATHVRAEFSWQKMTQQVLESYLDVLNT
jgi:glycosyltransferase involved in cell wall biosynthesis